MMKSTNFMVSGSHDGKIVIWNQLNLSVEIAFVIKINQIKDQILCLEQLEQNIFMSGTMSGIITIWNLKGTHYFIRTFVPHPE
jgi:WD40 repeat protein